MVNDKNMYIRSSLNMYIPMYVYSYAISALHFADVATDRGVVLLNRPPFEGSFYGK